MYKINYWHQYTIDAVQKLYISQKGYIENVLFTEIYIWKLLVGTVQ